MATVNYFVVGKTNPAEIRVRYVNAKAVDAQCGTNLYVDPKYWDKDNQKVRNVIAVTNRDKINSALLTLKSFIIEQANDTLLDRDGELIDRAWLQNRVARHFNRPAGQLKKAPDNHRIYLSDFGKDWMKTVAPTYKVADDKYMDRSTKSKYDSVLEIFAGFEGKAKVKLKDLTVPDPESDARINVFDHFAAYLTADNYTKITVARMIRRLKFFCERAAGENLEVDKRHKERVFVAAKKENYKYPYHPEHEIVTIFNLPLPDKSTIDNVRDNFIIGLWTCLRVSDFLTRLKTENFDGDFIDIMPLKTTNYKTVVSIPVHWMVRKILEKHGGKLPPKISEQKFNKYIKVIGEMAGFKDEMLGGITVVGDDGKKRKVVGMYPKYQLMTSHICRRSFATNHIEIIPKPTIMAVGGWTSEKQLMEYVQMTNREHAETLKKVWDKRYSNVN